MILSELYKERQRCENSWDTVYLECLYEKMDQIKLASAMDHLCKIDFLILKQEKEEKQAIADSQETILKKEKNKDIEFHKRKNFDIESFYESLGIKFMQKNK